MISFLKKIIVFNIPLLSIMGMLFFILYRNGEIFTSIDRVIKSEEKYLVGYEFNEQNYAYLKWRTLDLKPRYEIIALGSSRVLPFRKNMFETSFYNASYTIQRAEDFISFLKGIHPNKYPKVVIIGLDQWMFNKEWNNKTESREPHYWKNSYTNNFSFALLKNMALKIYQNEYTINDLIKKEARYGLNANTENTGFRNDGSMFYGSLIKAKMNNDTTISDYNFKDTYQRIDNGNRRFEYADNIDEKTIKTLKELIDFCSENNIHIVAFLPPYADAVMEKMRKSKKYDYLNKIDKNISSLFRDKGFEYYSFPTMNSINSNDNETYDGFHGSEVAYLKLLIQMLKQNSKLGQFTDIDKLQNDFTEAKSPYIVYDY